ncbi:hypothetical protein Tco_0036887 [Tanacetum coccineum]
MNKSRSGRRQSDPNRGRRRADSGRQQIQQRDPNRADADSDNIFKAYSRQIQIQQTEPADEEQDVTNITRQSKPFNTNTILKSTPTNAHDI